MPVDFVVPEIASYGGIQKYAIDSYHAISDQFRGDLQNWDPGRQSVALEAIRRLAPKDRVARTLWQMTDGATYLSTRLHYWHVGAAFVGVRPAEYYLTCHGSEILDANLPRYRRNFVARLVEGASGIVVPSNFTAALVRNSFGLSLDKVHVVHPSVQPLTVEPVARTQMLRSSLHRSAKRGEIVVGTIARMSERKNHQNIIAALELASEELGIALEYWIAGDGPLRESVLDRLRVSSIAWSYFGRIDEATKWAGFLPNLSVFCLPSLYGDDDVEGFGIVYVEANAAGVPVVASAAGGVPDAISPGQTGRMVEANNPASIAQGLAHLVRDNGVAVANDCRAWAGRFTSESVAMRLNRIYGSS